MIELPEAAQKNGFSQDPVGTHGSRTIMLAELRRLLAVCPEGACLEAYRVAVVEDNALLKETLATRRESFRRLRELYALTPIILLFRALRDLWAADTEAQPLLALLCAAARDPILRTTSGLILGMPEGDPVTPQMIAEAASRGFPGRYNPTMLANIGRHAASSWQQSGHLQGRIKKVRARAVSRPANVAYALFLSYLCDVRGAGLFDTLWTSLLDAPTQILTEQAVLASQMGWIEYRHGGGVTDISFNYLLRNGREGR